MPEFGCSRMSGAADKRSPDLIPFWMHIQKNREKLPWGVSRFLPKTLFSKKMASCKSLIAISDSRYAISKKKGVRLITAPGSAAVAGTIRRTTCAYPTATTRLTRTRIGTTITGFAPPGLQMKTYKHLFNKIVSKENLYAAAHFAARGKRERETVADFLFYLEEETQQLQKELVQQTYKHGKYRSFTVRDSKERLISAAPFRDRVVHHAVHDVVEPLFDNLFIYDSYACRKNKGTHRALDRTQSFLRANTYYFHGDIQKYFSSIEHNILKDLLYSKIKDEQTLWLIDKIIDSAKIQGGRLVKGIPIGNLTSQFFANLYLNELDKFAKFNLGQRYYLRYMDDFLFFSNTKQALQGIKREVSEFVEKRLHLRLHQAKSQIYKTSIGLSFLGFRIFHSHRRLLKDNVRRFKKRLKRFKYLYANRKVDVDEISNSLRCWVAHASYANTYNLRKRIFREAVFE